MADITRHIKDLLRNDAVLRNLQVCGEISNFTHHRSGHMYFRLKDASATLRCVFFRRENEVCPFKPENGMQVILGGSVSVYEPDGSYQFYVSSMEPAGTGSLFIAFEQLKKRLEQEGLFQAERKRPLPFLPRKIGLVTSPSGAALQDLLAAIRKRFPNVHLLVVESLVQGPDASRDLSRAIEVLNGRDDVDLIILTRGGGSLEDLWPFNEEPVARAIYGSRLPVVSAVGHETDFTIADFTADLRVPTPTAAAAAVLPDRGELLEALDRLVRDLSLALQGRLQREKQRLDYTIGESIAGRPLDRIKSGHENLKQLELRLKRDIVNTLRLQGLKLGALQDRLESSSPLKVMGRGYSYCRDEDGRIIRSVKSLQVGRLLQLNFRDGRAFCRTEKIEEDSAIEG